MLTRSQSKGTESGDGAKRSKKSKKAQLSEPPTLPNFDGWLPIYDTGTSGEDLHPVIAGTPHGWRERWAGVCDDCFQSGDQCPHYPEVPLRLLIIGHNPSQKTWEVRMSKSTDMVSDLFGAPRQVCCP